MDGASEQKLSGVNADLAGRVRAMAGALAAQGIPIRIISGFRSFEQQAALYANRANNRNPVAVPGTSKHERGLAVDIATDGGDWQTIGTVGEAQGLRWGGRFSRPDNGHFELLAASSVPDTSSNAGNDYASVDNSGDDWSDGAQSDNNLTPLLIGAVVLLIALEIL